MRTMFRCWPLLSALLIVACLVPGPSVAGKEAAPQSPPVPLAWKDLQGHRYGLADVSRSKATVFLFSSTECPIARLYAPRMAKLARQFQPRGVRFFLVNSNPEDDRASVARFVKEFGVTFPAVKDEDGALADRLEAQATPEAIVLDANGETRYMGRIDDNQDRSRVTRQDLRDALEAILAGKPVKYSRTIPFGCAIFRRDRRQTRVDGERSASSLNHPTVTYTRDVAPILNAKCVVCHRPGEVAPFALTSYQQARTWAKPIEEYTARRVMPPWKATPGYGEFLDPRYLTEKEIAVLGQWADAGAPPGDPKLLPPAPHFPPADAWPLGTPDMVVRPVRPYHLDAEGKDVYRNFVLPVEFKEDRYLRAIDFKPDNRAVVHHIVTYFDPTGESAKLDGKETEPGYTVPGIGIGINGAVWGEVWVPGSSRRLLPENLALRIPAGAKIVMQVHYHKTGKPEVDQSRMALYFAKGPVAKVVRTALMGTVDIQIPPGDDHKELHARLVVPWDAHIWNVFPHMHMLGKEMKVTATLPDGTVKPLIWVKDWDFNWQMTYYYREPLALPQGTRLDLTAVYDNSARNPHQTSQPPRLVSFGEQTTDEMCFAFFGFTLDRENLTARAPAEAGNAAARGPGAHDRAHRGPYRRSSSGRTYSGE